MIDKTIFINKLKLSNRISVSPMCQYSADMHGNPSVWHFEHLNNLSRLGAGLLMVESTAVSKEARITLSDLVLSNEKNYLSFKKLVKFIKKKKKIKVGIQISHAGRKGSSFVPWKKSNSPLLKNSWQTYSSSAIPKDKHWPKPKELNHKQIKKIKLDYMIFIMSM
jgi:2,4-dienoyl-CoA reductase-like NADH-dependent reductase (Old Yellow Enzyme family)